MHPVTWGQTLVQTAKPAGPEKLPRQLLTWLGKKTQKSTHQGRYACSRENLQEPCLPKEGFQYAFVTKIRTKLSKYEFESSSKGDSKTNFPSAAPPPFPRKHYLRMIYLVAMTSPMWDKDSSECLATPLVWDVA